MSRFPLWYAPGTNQVTSAPYGWDKCVIAGVEIGAWSRVMGSGPHLKIDPRNKKGAVPAHPTIHGLDVWEFQTRFAVPDREWLDIVDEQFSRLCPPGNVDKKGDLYAVSFDHPQLLSVARLLGRVDVLVKSLPLWVPSQAMGRGWETTIAFLYWPAASKGASTAKSSAPTYSVPNLRAAGDRRPERNPSPTSKPGFGGPPPGI